MFDIARLKQLAGVQLNESWDDDDGDDGLSPAERKLAAKADGDLKKKGVNVGKVDPDKDMHSLARRRKAADSKKEEATDNEEKEEASKAKAEKTKEKDNAPKAEEEKPDVKKEEPKAEEKKEEKKEEAKTEAKTEAKRRGKPVNPDSKASRALAWVKANPNAGGGEFAKWAAANIDMGKNYANTYFHGLKAKARAALKASANECYIIAHPTLKNFFLYENREMNQFQWIDESSPFGAAVFESESDAKKVAKYMEEWKNQISTVVRVNMDADQS